MQTVPQQYDTLYQCNAASSSAVHAHVCVFYLLTSTCTSRHVVVVVSSSIPVHNCSSIHNVQVQQIFISSSLSSNSKCMKAVRSNASRRSSLSLSAQYGSQKRCLKYPPPRLLCICLKTSLTNGGSSYQAWPALFSCLRRQQ